MTTWSLSQLFSGLHAGIQQRLDTIRMAMAHSTAKGDGSERVWLELLQEYLPRRYQAERAFVVDSCGDFSAQIDVVIFDRQYSPFIFHREGQMIVPAESVYAIFEARQSINAENVRYAQEKVASVRKLYRTSLPIPHAGGIYRAKPLIPILGGLLTYESDWSPAMGKPLESALASNDEANRLDLGCIAAHGYFYYDANHQEFEFLSGCKPATAFLFKLISQLQFSGTVPMIDIQSYAKWLSE